MADMDMEIFRSLIPSFSRLDSLNLSGYGEPFLNPDLVSMIRLSRERLPASARISLTSNGTLITPDLAKEVLEAGLDGITLSMDSLEADQFPAIRDGTPLKTVTECLETFVNLRERHKKDSFHIGISFVAMERNIQELPWLIQFAADHHVNAVWVNNVLPHTEPIIKETLYDSHSQDVLELFARTKERLNELGVSPSVFRPLAVRLSTRRSGSGMSRLSPQERLALQCVQEVSSGEVSMGGILASMLQVFERDGIKFSNYLKIFDESQGLAASRNLELHLPRIIPRTKRECNFIMNQTCFITWDGWVRPCNQLAHDYSCFHYGRPKGVKSISLGRVTEEDLKAIWDSEPYRIFRENVLKFPFSPCGDCGLSDGCGYLSPDADFFFDCNMYDQPCGDCLWSRGILNCP
jgi:putative metalloenzyme radical SAM/SPASM domain maturase